MVKDEIDPIVTKDEIDQCIEIVIRAVGEADALAHIVLSPEQRLWSDVVCSAIREAFSPDPALRAAARDWLLSESEADYSASWACDAVGIEQLSRIRRWIERTENAIGAKAVGRLAKARP